MIVQNINYARKHVGIYARTINSHRSTKHSIRFCIKYMTKNAKIDLNEMYSSETSGLHPILQFYSTTNIGFLMHIWSSMVFSCHIKLHGVLFFYPKCIQYLCQYIFCRLFFTIFADIF